MITWTPFVDLVRRKQRFLLTTHIRPDGDGLGSMLALAEVLERLGKQVRLVIASTWPPRYDFLDSAKRIERFEAPGNRWRDMDAIIVLDTGTWNQLGDFGTFMKSVDVPKIVIDHHLSQDDLGAIQLVDTGAEATGRLVYEAIEALQAPLTANAATMLFVALTMDTGWFVHSNTTAATFSLAAKLTAAGADPAALHTLLHNQHPLGRVKLRAAMGGRVELAEGGKVAYSVILRSDYPKTGSTPQDSEDLVNDLLSIAGVQIGVLFMEQPAGGVKISFRSHCPVDVRLIAEQFGGGGHKAASGAIVPDPLDGQKGRVLEAVHRAMTSGS